MFFPNRTVCQVLEEIRKCHETRNYSYLPGLLEEIQSMANRMEAKLHDQKDIASAEKRITALKAELTTLRAEKSILKPETADDY